MKSKLLLFIATLVASTGASMIQAQTAIPYLPIKADFGGTSANLTEFIPSTSDYTLEVDGVAGTEISIAGGMYTYTPTVTGKVRFSQEKEKVYVYEGNTYKTQLTPVPQATFPVITNEDVATNPAQLLSNCSFEDLGSLVGGSNYNFGKPWVTNAIVASSGGIRVGTNTSAVNGKYVAVWRGSGNTNYFAQPLSKLKASTTYKVQIKQVAGSNAFATFNVGLGSTVNGMEYGKKPVILGNTKNNTDQSPTWDVIIMTPSTLAETTYFTFSNTPSNTASSGSDPLTQIDYISLVEGVSSKGITGATNATYLEGNAYAPSVMLHNGDYFNMTSFVKNPTMDVREHWISTTGAQNNGLASNKKGDFTGTYWENWNGSEFTGKLYQIVTGLPNGKYMLKAATFCDQGGAGFYLYGNESKFAVSTTEPTYHSVEFLVTLGTAEIGLVAEQATNKWIGLDNVNLFFYGYDATAAINALNKQILDATEVASKKMNTSVLSALNTAISNATAAINTATEDALDNAAKGLTDAITIATTSAASYTSLISAIEAATLKKEEYKNISGYQGFAATISTIQNMYDAATIGEEEIKTQLSNLKAAESTCLETAPNYTSYIVNPAASSNSISGWTAAGNIKLRTMNNEHYSEATNPYFDTDNWGDKVVGKISQEITGLPAGTYLLKAAARGAANAKMILYANDQTTIVPCIGNTNGELGRGWNWTTVKTTITEGQLLTIGMDFNNDASSRWFSFDDFSLYRLDIPYAVINHNNTLVTVTGAISSSQANEINAALTSSVTSMDLTSAIVSDPITITATNPNTIVYGATSSVKVTSGISEGGDSSPLNETYAFHAPAPLAAKVHYYRQFNMNNQPCNQDNGNWQTICLPFDVTSMTAKQGENRIDLIPIKNFTGAEGDTDPRPFWLYEIGIGDVLTPATEMKANIPYLIAIPNDPDTYKDFYNVNGDVYFGSTSIAMTEAKSGNTSAYSLTANFAPIAANENDYGINAEGTQFVPGVAIHTFSAKATPAGNAKPAFLSIFGDDSGLTALPSIPAAKMQNGIEVFTVENGVMIQSSKEAQISIFEVSGKLVNAAHVTEGMNYITLPAGQYVINGSVILVK